MDKFVRISREVLLGAKDRINMDLYFQRKNKDGVPEYTLFAKAGMGHMAFKKIADNPVGALYIRLDHMEQYTSLIEQNLEQVVEDPQVTSEEKADAVYICAVDVVKDTFSDPRSGDNIKRSENLVNSMVSYALKEPGAIKSLLGLGRKDYYTFSHCVHVCVFSVGLAKVFNLTDPGELYKLSLGALLHDVGKTKVDPKILNKPDKLTPEEFDAIKMHSVYGYQMLEDMIPVESLDVVLHHHEKFNGQGYPDKLSKDQISLFAKIVALADVYDALTTNRVYARARDPFDAIITMKQEMIGHFEEEKFMSFIKMLGPGVKV